MKHCQIRCLCSTVSPYHHKILLPSHLLGTSTSGSNPSPITPRLTAQIHIHYQLLIFEVFIDVARRSRENGGWCSPGRRVGNALIDARQTDINFSDVLDLLRRRTQVGHCYESSPLRRKNRVWASEDNLCNTCNSQKVKPSSRHNIANTPPPPALNASPNEALEDEETLHPYPPD